MTDAGDPTDRPRLGEDKLETLRHWGEGLRQVRSEELRAAGRAILLLVEEIERLHIDLWHARQRAADAPAPPAAREEGEEHALSLTLRERVRRKFRPDRDAFPETYPQPVEEPDAIGDGGEAPLVG